MHFHKIRNQSWWVLVSSEIVPFSVCRLRLCPCPCHSKYDFSIYKLIRYIWLLDPSYVWDIEYVRYLMYQIYWRYVTWLYVQYVQVKQVQHILVYYHCLCWFQDFHLKLKLDIDIFTTYYTVWIVHTCRSIIFKNSSSSIVPFLLASRICKNSMWSYSRLIRSIKFKKNYNRSIDSFLVKLIYCMK